MMALEDTALRLNEEVKALEADLKVAQAIIVDAGNQVEALKAENARLMRLFIAVEARIDTDLRQSSESNPDAAILQLLEDEIAIKKLCMEALQPASEVK